MNEATPRIWFVTAPDNAIFRGSETSRSDRHAVNLAIQHFLPEAHFPGLHLEDVDLTYHMRATLWDAMQRAGYRVQSVSTAS
jgi:hypothetical protein